MQLKESLQEFLYSSLLHLMQNPGKFHEKLESGDINAIKTLFDFVNKISPGVKDVKSCKNTKISANYEDMKYEDAFECYKEDFIDGNSEK